MKAMTTIHMSEGEISGNFSAVLEKIRHGAQVVVDLDHRPIAIIRSPGRTGRSISECIASAAARDSSSVADDDFAQDVEDGIKDRQQAWNPPCWD